MPTVDEIVDARTADFERGFLAGSCACAKRLRSMAMSYETDDRKVYYVLMGLADTFDPPQTKKEHEDGDRDGQTV